RGEVSADGEPRTGVFDLPGAEKRDEDGEVLAGVSVRAVVRETPHVFYDHAMRGPDAEREATPRRGPRRRRLLGHRVRVARICRRDGRAELDARGHAGRERSGGHRVVPVDVGKPDGRKSDILREAGAFDVLIERRGSPLALPAVEQSDAHQPGPSLRAGRDLVPARGVDISSTPLDPARPLSSARTAFCPSLLECDEASDSDELAIFRRLEIGGLHTRVIRGAVAETWHERAREVLHLVEVRHEALAGQLFARALERLDEYLTVRVSGLGEPTDLLFRGVLRHERL